MKSKLKWLIGVFVIALFATAFIPLTKKNIKKNATTESVKKKPVTDYTLYYWFTPGTSTCSFIRSNTIDDEEALTGWDEGQYNPKTKQERGYTVSMLRTISPPTIFCYMAPIKTLWSHP